MNNENISRINSLFTERHEMGLRNSPPQNISKHMIGTSFFETAIFTYKTDIMKMVNDFMDPKNSYGLMA